MRNAKRIKARMRTAQRLGFYYPVKRGTGLHYVGRAGGTPKQGFFDCGKCNGYGYGIANGPDGLEYPECVHCDGEGHLKRLYHVRSYRRLRFFKTKVARANFDPGYGRWLKWRNRMLSDKSGRYQ